VYFRASGAFDFSRLVDEYLCAYQKTGSKTNILSVKVKDFLSYYLIINNFGAFNAVWGVSKDSWGCWFRDPFKSYPGVCA
jgi:hypothetical protein